MGFKPMIEFSCISIQQTNLSAGRIVATFQGMPAEIPSLQEVWMSILPFEYPLCRRKRKLNYRLHLTKTAFRVFNLASSGRRDPPSSQLERTSSRHRQRVNRTLRLHRRGCLSPSQIRHRCPQSVIRGSVPRHQNVRHVEEVVSHIVHRSKLKRYFSSGEENNECPKMKSSRQHEALLLRY
ncbi:unnamed protein product [Brassica oleracea]|uniref:(rape) hypothetical protein n=1 Tax=Brassica napus TaxID=3708 RepID=A0A816MT54_BRANA|nr:unnamed protein product [Brassica napus]